MKLYCAHCGQRLTLIRKALPKLGVIVDLVQYHECPQVMDADFNFDFNAPMAPSVEGRNICLSTLDKLEPSRGGMKTPSFGEAGTPDLGQAIGATPSSKRVFGGVSTEDLRDRRFEQSEKPIVSTAPSTILDQIKAMTNSIPAHDIKDIEEGSKESTESEMEG